MVMRSLSLEEFTAELGSSSPAPGGGSASALAGALAASLSSMVANLTVGKKGYEDEFEAMKGIAVQAQRLREDLLTLIDTDAESFNEFLRALRLPKDSAQEKLYRTQCMQQALKRSSEIPMQIAQKSFALFPLAHTLLLHGNQNAVTDAAVSVMLARTAVLGALLNVRINLQSIKDESFVADMTAQADTLEHEVIEKEKELLALTAF